MIAEKTLAFRLFIVIDYGFNVLTGGGFQTCFSTRAYYKERTTGSKMWYIIRCTVDKIMFEENHCKSSYYWEISRKKKWLIDHKL